MPVSNTVSVTGSSAFFDVNASGSGFGIFSSYSAYASEAVSYTGSTTAGMGSFSLALDTSFGNLVFSGTDTINASTAGYTFSASDSLSFVTGSDTLTFATGTFSGGSSLSSFATDLNSFYSSITTINSAVSLSDSVASAAASDVASDVAIIVNAATPTVAGGTTSSSADGVQFHFTKLG